MGECFGAGSPGFSGQNLEIRTTVVCVYVCLCVITCAKTWQNAVRRISFLAIRWIDVGKQKAGTPHFLICKLLWSLECKKVSGCFTV